ncbi:hypothetical protein BDN71DRAFT_1431745 [Pleurotus eryngii]|uniref:Uncharacterized protein n=1 Tax=Pleurotus eryngii TaxID=5323 RepID=A0A9P6DFG3_PLEER|nr:hypothetical protein BDN71DRAFT_1431745 [Pleurotus eryngii]
MYCTWWFLAEHMVTRLVVPSNVQKALEDWLLPVFAHSEGEQIMAHTRMQASLGGDAVILDTNPQFYLLESVGGGEGTVHGELHGQSENDDSASEDGSKLDSKEGLRSEESSLWG